MFSVGDVEKVVSRTTFTNEKDVKRVVRRVLKELGVFAFMPPANAYGKVGISDILAVGNGKAIAIETKFGRNKPTINQIKFGNAWTNAGGLFLVVNERNIVNSMADVMEFINGKHTD